MASASAESDRAPSGSPRSARHRAAPLRQRARRWRSSGPSGEGWGSPCGPRKATRALGAARLRASPAGQPGLGRGAGPGLDQATMASLAVLPAQRPQGRQITGILRPEFRSLGIGARPGPQPGIGVPLGAGRVRLPTDGTGWHRRPDSRLPGLPGRGWSALQGQGYPARAGRSGCVRGFPKHTGSAGRPVGSRSSGRDSGQQFETAETGLASCSWPRTPRPAGRLRGRRCDAILPGGWRLAGRRWWRVLRFSRTVWASPQEPRSSSYAGLDRAGQEARASGMSGPSARSPAGSPNPLPAA